MVEVIELQVEGMTCAHCERAVTQAIKALDPTADVAVDLKAGTVRATSALPTGQLAAAIVAEGYRVAPKVSAQRHNV